MTGSDQANDSGAKTGGDSGSRGDVTRQFWSPWQDRISWRLNRSVTIGLLLSPIGLLLISVARLLIVSDYNTATASAIVSSGGYVDALLGTIIPVVPFLLPYLALVLLFFNRVVLAILALLATALISPVTVSRLAASDLARKDWDHILGAPLVVAVIMGILAFLIIILLLTAILSSGFGNFARTLAPIACIALIPVVSQIYSFPVARSFYTNLIRQPWLPAETITLTSGQSIVGYVLADSGSSVAVLLNGNRMVYYYPDANVAKRQVCEIGQIGQMQPLITFLPAGTNPSSSPQCRLAAVSLPLQGHAGVTMGHDMLPPLRSLTADEGRAHGW